MRTSEDIVTPASYVRYLRDGLDLTPSEIHLPRRGVVVFGTQDFEMFRGALRGRRARWDSSECVGRSGRYPVAVKRSYIGGPAASIAVEEMAVRGAKDIFFFGACGSIRVDLQIGSIVLPSFAVPDEGTSLHYGAPRRPRPSPSLVEAIRAACRRARLVFLEGGVWTCGAPYRETSAKARRFSKQGVVGVEMEAAAIYAVARYRRLRAASLMVVSDELGGVDWNIGLKDARFIRSKRLAVRALVDALSRPWR